MVLFFVEGWWSKFSAGRFLLKQPSVIFLVKKHESVISKKWSRNVKKKKNKIYNYKTLCHWRLTYRPNGGDPLVNFSIFLLDASLLIKEAPDPLWQDRIMEEKISPLRRYQHHVDQWVNVQHTEKEEKMYTLSYMTNDISKQQVSIGRCIPPHVRILKWERKNFITHRRMWQPISGGSWPTMSFFWGGTTALRKVKTLNT